MSTSPKRKSDHEMDLSDSIESKKLRLIQTADAPSLHINQAVSRATIPADSLIDHAAALQYWSGIDATVSGVLGGFPQLSRVDLQSSGNFLAKLRRTSKEFPPGPKLRRVVDCGAGIGRITAGLLAKVAETVDVVEPVKKLTDAITTPGVGEIFHVGLQEWFPRRADGEGQDRSYDLIWNQWCCNQLTDKQLEEYFARLPPVLSAGGWIIVKENTARSDEDVFDDVDSSVTRSEAHFRAIFARAGLRIVKTELQKGFLRDLYPVRIWALQPK